MNRLLCSAVALGVLSLSGCASTDVHEFVPEVGQVDRIDQRRTDPRVGHSNKCHTFKDGGEVCEWSVQQIDGRYETIGLTFNSGGKACEWSYRGFYGQQASKAKC
ncbi:MAG: hypothetical protein U0361_04795 [Nitrospiraceae bacterium]